MSCPNPVPLNYCNQRTYDLQGGCVPIIPGLITSPAYNNLVSYCQDGKPREESEWTFLGNTNSKGCLSQAKPADQAGKSVVNGCTSDQNTYLFAGGLGAICEREKFLGDPEECCFKDYAYNNCRNENSCFESQTSIVYHGQPASPESRTCDPKTRDINNNACRERVADYCTGADLPANDSSWIFRWMNFNGTPQLRAYSDLNPLADPKQGVCMYMMRRALFTETDPASVEGQLGTNNCNVPDPKNTGCGQPLPISYQSEGFAWTQNFISRVFLRYNQSGYRIGSRPGEVGYSSFQDFLYKYICCAYPGLCTQALRTICPAHSADQLARNSTLNTWCGCYLNLAEYSRYVNDYQIDLQCTPLCNRTGVIPLVDGGAQPITCKQNVCLIDDVNLSLTSSLVKEDINFANVCGNCGTGVCSCIIEGVDISIANSVVNGVITQQNCSNQNCQIRNPSSVGPDFIPISCESLDEQGNPIQEPTSLLENDLWKNRILTGSIFLGAFLIVSIIIFLIVSLGGKKRK